MSETLKTILKKGKALCPLCKKGYFIANSDMPLNMQSRFVCTNCKEKLLLYRKTENPMTIIGKYKEINHDENLPSVFDNISVHTHPEKEKIISFMESAEIQAAAPAILIDVISGERIEEELTFMVKEPYGWRSDVLYYFKKYNLRLPDDFISWCLTNVQF